jgi:hypothetical protein
LGDTAKERSFAVSATAISTSLIDMGAMIERTPPELKERRRWTP